MQTSGASCLAGDSLACLTPDAALWPGTAAREAPSGGSSTGSSSSSSSSSIPVEPTHANSSPFAAWSGAVDTAMLVLVVALSLTYVLVHVYHKRLVQGHARQAAGAVLTLLKVVCLGPLYLAYLLLGLASSAGGSSGGSGSASADGAPCLVGAAAAAAAEVEEAAGGTAANPGFGLGPSRFQQQQQQGREGGDGGTPTERRGGGASAAERVAVAGLASLAGSRWLVDPGKLRIEAKIGGGAFGTVYRGTLRSTPVAIKCLPDLLDDVSGVGGVGVAAAGGGPVSGRDAGRLRALAREVELLARISSPHVVLFLGVCLAPPACVTEFCSNGSLFDVLAAARKEMRTGGAGIGSGGTGGAVINVSGSTNIGGGTNAASGTGGAGSGTKAAGCTGGAGSGTNAGGDTGGAGIGTNAGGGTGGGGGGGVGGAGGGRVGAATAAGVEGGRGSDGGVSGMLTWRRRLSMALDAALGMAHLHARGILHRDLKSPNLLVDSGWRVKVGDFGLSTLIEAGAVGGGGGGRGNSASLTATNPRWMPPEVIAGGAFAWSADVYSFGVVLWELLTWQEPFATMGCAQIIHAVAVRRTGLALPPLRQLPGQDPPCPGLDDYVALMRHCLEQDSWRRPRFEEVATRLRELQLRLGP